MDGRSALVLAVELQVNVYAGKNGKAMPAVYMLHDVDFVDPLRHPRAIATLKLLAKMDADPELDFRPPLSDIFKNGGHFVATRCGTRT